MVDTVKVSACGLHGMLTDLQRTACKDATLPHMTGVLLHSAEHDGNTVLVGCSTDRYVLGMAFENADGSVPAVFVPAESVKTLLAALAPNKTSSMPVELTVSDSDVSATWSGGSATVPVLLGKNISFPQPEKLMNRKRVPADTVTLEPSHLEKLTSVAKRRKERMRFEVISGMGPSHVFIGENYRALLMPVRASDDPASCPAFARGE